MLTYTSCVFQEKLVAHLQNCVLWLGLTFTDPAAVSQILLTSLTIESTGRDRSLPRVNGTMQNEHMLLQPRITDTNAVTEFCAIRTGETSA